METANHQSTDPEVSKKKFDKELAVFNDNRDRWRAKGVFLVHSHFPVTEFLFTTPKLTPAGIVFCVRIDFTNYDTEPLSVKCISPFTREVLLRKDILIEFPQVNMHRLIPGQVPVPQDLLQGPPDGIPFFCFQGVREYHNHPAHTGNGWFLHRGTGVGTLNYILDQLYSNSIVHIPAYTVQMHPKINFKQHINVVVQQ